MFYVSCTLRKAVRNALRLGSTNCKLSTVSKAKKHELGEASEWKKAATQVQLETHAALHRAAVDALARWLMYLLG